MFRSNVKLIYFLTRGLPVCTHLAFSLFSLNSQQTRGNNRSQLSLHLSPGFLLWRMGKESEVKNKGARVYD